MSFVSRGFKAWRALFAAACLTLASTASAQGTEPVFTIGVLPNMSARVVLANYQPMRAYFERELKRRVEIATAADFRAFSAATARGDFHMAVTAANVGRINQLDAQWEPAAIYEPPIPGVLVASVANPHASADQLRGRSLALANPQSLVALRGLQWLREQHNLVNGRDFRTVLASNDESLGTLIRSGEVPMALMSLGEFRQIGEETRKSLRVVTEFAKVPAFLVMTNPKLALADQRKVKTLILQFPGTDDGKRFMALSGFSNIREVTATELSSLDAYADETRTGLGTGK